MSQALHYHYLAQIVDVVVLWFALFGNTTTSGNTRTAATKLASNGDPLSLRQVSSNGRGKSKSVTGSKTIPCGQRQRVALLTNATPILHDTRLRIVASFTASCMIQGDFSLARKHSCIRRS